MTDHKLLMVSDADIDMARMIVEIDRTAGRQPDPAILRIANAAETLPTQTDTQPVEVVDPSPGLAMVTKLGSFARATQIKEPPPIQLLSKYHDNGTVFIEVAAETKPRNKTRSIFHRALTASQTRRAARARRDPQDS